MKTTYYQANKEKQRLLGLLYDKYGGEQAYYRQVYLKLIADFKEKEKENEKLK